MVFANLPGFVCSQRFTYIDDIGRRTISHGLRIDMRRWIKARFGHLPRYRLTGNQVVFEFENRGHALLFLLRWTDADQILNEEPVDRALINLV